MPTSLLDDEKFTELMQARERPLTPSQRTELQKIRLAARQLNFKKETLDSVAHVDEFVDELSDDAFEDLREQEIEVLTNEKPSLVNRLQSLLLTIIKHWRPW